MNARPIDLALVLALGWLLIISYACLVPVADQGPSWPYLDKIMHALMFAVGGFLAGLLAANWPQRLLVVLLLIGLGGLLEGLQAQTGLRHAEWADWFADALGTVLGLALSLWAFRLGGRR